MQLALADVAAARGWRAAGRLAALADVPGTSPQVLERLACSARASAELERLLAPGGGSAVDLGGFVKRFATLRAIASGGPMILRTSVTQVLVSTDLVRAVTYAVCELIEVVETMGQDAPELMVAVEPGDRELVVAVAAVGADACPVPGGAGAAALRRAERLAAGLGGDIVRGVRDGMMLFGVMLPVAGSAGS